MIAIAFLFVGALCDSVKSRRRLETEILVLRHQLHVLQQRAPRRLHLRWAARARDRLRDFRRHVGSVLGVLLAWLGC